MIILPWPPSSLSGHNTGHYRERAVTIKRHREWARLATLEAGVKVDWDGDIFLSLTFYPPNNRGDRVNFWSRAKPMIDGIADGLGVNDKRFAPAGYYVGGCVPGGKVIATVLQRP